MPVSYTHLDVYKRQTLKCPPRRPCFFLHGKRDIVSSVLNVLTHRLLKRLRISSEDKHDISIYRPYSPG